LNRIKESKRKESKKHVCLSGMKVMNGKTWNLKQKNEKIIPHFLLQHHSKLLYFSLIVIDILLYLSKYWKYISSNSSWEWNVWTLQRLENYLLTWVNRDMNNTINIIDMLWVNGWGEWVRVGRIWDPHKWRSLGRNANNWYVLRINSFNSLTRQATG